MPERALLIVNPFSGKKNGEKIAAQIAEQLAGKGIEAQLFLSHSIEALDAFVAATDLNAFSFAGIIGGDGSMHEFINAVLKQHETVPVPVALFPCGTGNSFNFDIGCSTVAATLECIFSNSISFIDLAEVDYGAHKLWSFNILGCGLVAEINQLAERMRFLGGSRYTVASLIKLIANPVAQFTIKTDAAEYNGKYSFVLACNTRYTGKGMMMAPNAKLSDGKFDVLLVEACSFMELLRLFPKIFKGKHLGAKVLTYLQTDVLEVKSTKANLFTNIDGEIKGKLPFIMKVHKDKLRVFVKA
jgi:YegS/Rv2252/BmrU family lipid kinase